ncbi:MAG TPA: glycosyltransferase 87 family protein, partial [Candidatus Baltobacteraceae bacterium]|nr:glycosyltransferase 87 family protein [Candidatus Baltobacteraceae bacterium]
MRRLYLYGAGLTILCLAQVRFVVAQNFGDWSAFQSAGATVGTRALLDPVLHARWQSAHHVAQSTFPYLPGAAWALVPFAHLPAAAGYAINFVLMAAAALAAALLAAKIYNLPRDVTAVTAFAWAPLVAGLATGQNAPMGLLLCVCAIAGLARRSSLVVGLACGALLYKPLFALPLLLLLAVRREWRALGIAAVCGGMWYLLGVAATAGQWTWPVQYASAIRGYALHDFHINAVKAIGIPQLLM